MGGRSRVTKTTRPPRRRPSRIRGSKYQNLPTPGGPPNRTDKFVGKRSSISGHLVAGSRSGARRRWLTPWKLRCSFFSYIGDAVVLSPENPRPQQEKNVPNFATKSYNGRGRPARDAGLRGRAELP